VQNKALPDSTSADSEQKPTHSAHSHDTSMHSKCAISVSQNPSEIPDDLAKVVNAWDSLPNAVKVGILAMVDAAQQTE
jgi:hypothetical protein